jgi:hypothetical protein
MECWSTGALDYSKENLTLSEIPNYKLQITNKSQIPIINDQNLDVWDFEFRLLLFF